MALVPETTKSWTDDLPVCYHTGLEFQTLGGFLIELECLHSV